MNSNVVYVDTCILQKDRRIRLPKSILTNLNILSGEVKFEIFLNIQDQTIVLVPMSEKSNEKNQ
ncbi:hypothetical protein QQA45_03515 [Sneathia sanguinegens]|uniref:SpoVT-AbrB domain-containing protein n=1 Tax=Sneathia sanguinegens TaxID=40543 RepID=A0ABT7HKU2_9FUSO|nr:hypothetical protein [Sneathia sanguinegens]MDK9580585.1 hypothetical protein [Sneathia sanguinegens]